MPLCDWKFRTASVLTAPQAVPLGTAHDRANGVIPATDDVQDVVLEVHVAASQRPRLTATQAVGPKAIDAAG